MPDILSTGIHHVRPISHDRAKPTAIDEATKKGFWVRIFSARFDFEIDVALGAGAVVEETALMASTAGMPNPRPPFPAVKGLFGNHQHHNERPRKSP